MVSTFENQASAIEFDSHVNEYIREDLQHVALLGPFDSPPFDLHISPFMTSPKSGSEVRTIVDLSWPKGDSVNDGISNKTYLGSEFIL